MIQFHAPEAGKAEISLFNIAGRRVAQIQTTLANPGEQSVPYTVEKLANGVYFVTVKVEGRTLGTSRLVLQR